jgi:hypothetical protein
LRQVEEQRLQAQTFPVDDCESWKEFSLQRLAAKQGTLPKSRKYIFSTMLDNKQLSRRIRAVHLKHFDIWLESIISRARAEWELNKINVDKNAFQDDRSFIVNEEYKDSSNVEDDDSSPLTKEEVRKVREIISDWSELMQKSEAITEEQKDAVEEAAARANLELTKNKTSPRKKVLKFIGEILKDSLKKYITDKTFRDEANGKFMEAVRKFPQLWENIKGFL